MVVNYNFCPVIKEEHEFFSLVDYRNNKFISSNPEQVIEFYEGFSDSSQLIDWLKNRPKGNCRIKEVDGEKDIIVVVLTMDVNGSFSRECKNIYKGLHIIFVESGYNNFYFDISHNENIGIKMAMEYNPKWLVLSSDDMYKIDDVSTLTKSLRSLDPKKFSIVFTKETTYHSVTTQISKARILRKYALLAIVPFLAHKKKVALREMIHVKVNQIKLEEKFGCEYFTNSPKGLQRLIYKSGFVHKCYMDFAIISAFIVHHFQDYILDETFVNAYDDHDLSLRFFLGNLNYTFIDYRIGDYIGSSMGTGLSRELRNIAGLAYLNYKYKNRLSSLRNSKR